MLTRNGVKRVIKISIFILVSILVLGYAAFASHDFILGPSIEISEPKNGSTLDSASVTIVGVVKRVQDITLNGRSITIDDKGNFKESTLLSPGYNIFSMTAKDRFGRSKEYRLEYIYEVN